MIEDTPKDRGSSPMIEAMLKDRQHHESPRVALPFYFRLGRVVSMVCRTSMTVCGRGGAKETRPKKRDPNSKKRPKPKKRDPTLKKETRNPIKRPRTQK